MYQNRQRNWTAGRRRRGGGRAVLGVAALALAAVVVGVALAFIFDGSFLRSPGAAFDLTATQRVTTGTPAPARSAATVAPSPDETKSVEAAGRSQYMGTMDALSAVLLDADGKVLYAKDADERRYPASTTKVLTALLALENGDLDDTVTVGGEVNMIEPDSSVAGLKYGEKLTVEQLLNALLIPSGNDAAYVLAAYTGRKKQGNPDMDSGDAIQTFVGMMNDRAKELGATGSHFMNPDGYQDERHYTTARDMARIAMKAMENEEFRKIVATKRYKLPSVKGKDKNGKTVTVNRTLDNTNQLLDDGTPWHLDCCTGVKTGHTSDAGYCLVSAAQEHGRSVFAVVMDSTADAVWRDSSALLQWGVSPR